MFYARLLKSWDWFYKPLNAKIDKHWHEIKQICPKWHKLTQLSLQNKPLNDQKPKTDTNTDTD